MKKETSIGSFILMFVITFFVLMVVVYTNVVSSEHLPEQTINPYEEARVMEEKGLIKVGDTYLKYGVKENGEVKPITDILDKNCRTDHCKIESYFNYVKKIPYVKGVKDNEKNSVDVILNGAGDCDEKSHLFTSMLLQGKYKCVLVYTKDHTFVCVNIPNFQNDRFMSYIRIHNEKYYYAETTRSDAYLGAFNMIEPKDFEIILDPITKKSIPLETVQLVLNQEG